MTASRQYPLLEREHELARLEALADEARGGAGRLAVIEGPAGAGKTSLLAAVRQSAHDGGMEVLTARGIENERAFGFGVVRQLFEPALARSDPEERQRLSAGAAVVATALVGGPPAPVGDDVSFAMLHALCLLTSNFAQRRPLAIAIDDLTWADPSSLRFLDYLAGRLLDIPVLLVVAVRPDQAGDEAGALLQVPTAELIELSPLSEQAVAALLRASFDRPPAPVFVSACHVATDGSPRLLQALLADLRAHAVDPTLGGAREVAGIGSGSVARVVLAQLSRLPTDAIALADALSLLGGEAELRHAGRLAGLSPGDSLAGADALVHAGIVHPGRPVRFAHPIMQGVVHGRLASAERDLGHRRAAGMLADEQGSREQVAAHLLATEPRAEPATGTKLIEAARDARSRGAGEAAIAYLERALCEPPSPQQRTTVLCELGSAELSLGKGHAVGHLRQAIDEAAEARPRARAARQLAAALGIRGQVPEAVALLEDASGCVAAEDRDLHLQLESELAAFAKLDAQTVGVHRGERQRLHAEADGRTPGGRALLAERAFDSAVAGRSRSEAVRLAERALADPEALSAFPFSLPYYQAIQVLIVCDQFDAAGRVLEGAARGAEAAGSTVALAIASSWASHLALRRGAVARATDEARLSLGLLREHGWAAGRAASLGFLLDALVEKDQLDVADRLLEGEGFAGDLPAGITYSMLLESRGALRLAQGRFADAVADLREFGTREHDQLARNPACYPYRSHAALALAALDDPLEASRLASREERLAREFGTRRAVGIALRCRGLVDGGKWGIERLRQSVTVLEASEARLEHARSLTDLGGALRRADRRAEARKALRRAYPLAERCGAIGLRDRAHRELLACGARTQRLSSVGVDSLTPSERRVGALAADGQSNRQIAQALFLSAKTVEMHLSNAYRKLGIRSRSALPRGLAHGAGEMEPR